MDNQLKTNLLNLDTWLRLVYMVIFWVLLYVVGTVLAILVVLQFFFVLVAGERNANLMRLGIMLGTYVTQIIDFLTFSSSFKPFPFADFPDDSREPEDED